MSAPFNPGDLVICVDASGITSEAPQLQCGSIYTIAHCQYCPNAPFYGALPSIHAKSNYAVILSEIGLIYNSDGDLQGYAATRFSLYRPEHTLDEVRKRDEVPA